MENTGNMSLPIELFFRIILVILLSASAVKICLFFKKKPHVFYTYERTIIVVVSTLISVSLKHVLEVMGTFFPLLEYIDTANHITSIATWTLFILIILEAFLIAPKIMEYLEIEMRVFSRGKDSAERRAEDLLYKVKKWERQLSDNIKKLYSEADMSARKGKVEDEIVYINGRNKIVNDIVEIINTDLKTLNNE